MSLSSGSTYLGSLWAVVQAAERLDVGLEADRATASYAAQQLDRRLIEHADGKDAFSELGFAADQTPMPAEVAPEDALGGVLVELQAASLALAAAQATRESGLDGDPEPFRQALGDLRSTTRELERASAAPDELGFRWRRTIDPGTVEASADLDAARERFRGEVATTLEVLVEESGGVITAVGENLRRLPGVSLLDQALKAA